MPPRLIVNAFALTHFRDRPSVRAGDQARLELRGRWVRVRRCAVVAFLVAGSGLGLVPAATASTPAEDESSDQASSASRETASTKPPPPPPPPPIGVRFGETLEGDSVRIGYSWKRMHSQGLRVSADHVTPGDVYDLGYSQTPRSLEVTVHTFQIAYAPHPRVTLVAEVPFIQKELERVDPVALIGGRSRRQIQTEGVGDIAFSVVIPFIRKGIESSQVHIGFDVPTGSIRRKESIGTGSRILPYSAQTGNGTVDLEWGWTYKGETENFSWGGQAIGRHPVGRNDRDYREGSRFTGSLWAVAQLFAGVSASIRTEWEKQNNSEGFDRDLRPTFDPSESSQLRGGTRLSVAPGLTFDVPRLPGQRIAVEVGIPVYQDLDGPQLERDWTIKTGWQWVY